ncbi:MAG TPA: translation initiation factor [Anaeromyxobacteraceae bacterium]|nr:translation initiation factor [Anaeromyxobacteraceae bacterium]
MGKRTPTPPPAAPAAPFHSPFAKLAGLKADVPTAPAPAAPPAAAKPPPKPPPARAVVRIERKGRGGKEATVIEKLALPPKELAAWADSLKRSLGCGGAVEEDAIVVQGDQRERVRRWLEAKGVAKVIAG